MIVVSDTTPVNYLVIIGAEYILPELFGSVLVPSQVIQELLHEGTPTIVRNWANRLPVWVEVRSGDSSAFPLLDPGEAAALALGIEVSADASLVDDAQARSVAILVGLVPIGTLGVLADAHNAGLIDFDAAVAALKLRCSDVVISDVKRRLRGPSSPPN